MTHYSTGALLEKTERERRGDATRPATEEEDEERWRSKKEGMRRGSYAGSDMECIDGCVAKTALAILVTTPL